MKFKPRSLVFPALLLLAAGADPVPGTGRSLQFEPGVSDTGFRVSAMPPAAPWTHAGVAALKFPDANKLFRLRIHSGIRAGRHYRGPDGGKVRVVSRKTYTWRRRDGIQVTFYGTRSWRIIQGRHRIFYFSRRHCGYVLQWNFPDGSRLERCPIAGTNRHRYYYRKDYRDGTETGFQIFPPGYWVKNHEKIGRFRFHYTDRWKDHIMAYASRRKRADYERGFFKRMSDDFGFRHRGEIPVVFTDTVFQKQRVAGRSDVGLGGTGGYNEITICCGRNRKPYSRDAAVRAVQIKTASFKLLLHETIHNLQQHACRVIQRDNKAREGRNAEPWFTEGVAEYGATQFEKRDYAISIRKLYRLTDAGRMSSLASLNYRDQSFYIGGRAMIEYMIARYGNRTIRAYHKHRCLGRSARFTMGKLVGKTPDEVYADMLVYFRQKRDFFQARARKWELHGLPRLAHVNSDARRNVPAPRALLNIKTIPDPAFAYALDVSAYRGKYKGLFRGPEGRKVRLFSDGTYQIYGADFTAAYWPDGRRAFRFRGQRIFVWKNGDRRWTLRDGSSAYFNGRELLYYDGQQRLIEKTNE